MPVVLGPEDFASENESAEVNNPVADECQVRSGIITDFGRQLTLESPPCVRWAFERVKEHTSDLRVVINDRDNVLHGVLHQKVVVGNQTNERTPCLDRKSTRLNSSH